MKESKYTGDVAYYATMMALTEAMKSANIMLTHPNPLIGKSVEVLQDIALSGMPADIRARLRAQGFLTLVTNFVANCGINAMSVLQLVKKFENECAKNSRCC